MALNQPRRRIPDPRDRNARLAWLDGWWDRSVVHGAKVAVVGVGALGNEILKNLAMLDFRSITIIDRDTVEMSNLSRSVLFRPRHEGVSKVAAAVETVADLNPDVRITALHADVVHEAGLGYLREQDVIIAGLDSRRVRWWLNRHARALGVPWVEGATQGPHGHAMAFLPDEGPCYECGFGPEDWRALDDVASCRQLAVDAAAHGRVATSPTTASVIAAAQVHLAMDVLHGRPVVGGRGMLVNLSAPDLMISGRREDPDCEAHVSYGPVVETPLRAQTATVADLLAAAVPMVGEPATIELRWDSVWEFDCPGCGEVGSVRRARGLVRQSAALCPKCGDERRPVFRHRLDAQDCDLLLAAAGIPSRDVVEVRGPAGSRWFELAGDRAPGRIAECPGRDARDGPYALMDAIALGLITVMALLVGMGVYSHQRGQSRPGAPGSRPYGSGAPTSARPGTGARGRIRVVDPNVPSGRTPRADPTHIQVRSPETQGCQVCGDAIGPGEPYTECEAGHPHHRACTALTDHCAMQNCPRPFK